MKNKKTNKQFKVTIQEVTTTCMYIDAEDTASARTEAARLIEKGERGYEIDNTAYIQSCSLAE